LDVQVSLANCVSTSFVIAQPSLAPGMGAEGESQSLRDYTGWPPLCAHLSTLRDCSREIPVGQYSSGRVANTGEGASACRE
jgi:hypothetical protein